MNSNRPARKMYPHEFLAGGTVCSSEHWLQVRAIVDGVRTNREFQAWKRSR